MSLEHQSPSFAIVDDHTSVGQLLSYALVNDAEMRQIGMFGSVAAATAGLVEACPDIVIVDWNLDDGDGGQLVRNVGAKLPNTRWLLYTAVPTPYVVETAIRCGVQSCISKGASLPEVVKAVRSTLNGDRYLCTESRKAVTSFVQLRQPHTPREIEILRRIAAGDEVKAIADHLACTPKTIYNHLSDLRAKTKSSSMVELARYAEQQGIAPPTRS
jgi:two-component system uhpT operon response regulator UhpA